MSLSKEQIEKNKSIFTSINKTYGIFPQELLDYLGDDLFHSPASTSNDMYGCYPGGLMDHLIKSCTYASHTNDLLPENLRAKKESVVKCVFLSQIGKVFMFEFNDNDWQVKNRGIMYKFTEDRISMRVPDKSLYLLSKYGIKLDETEYQAISNLGKDDDDKMSKYHSETLFSVIKMGFELAILEEKNGER